MRAAFNADHKGPFQAISVKGSETAEIAINQAAASDWEFVSWTGSEVFVLHLLFRKRDPQEKETSWGPGPDFR